MSKGFFKSGNYSPLNQAIYVIASVFFVFSACEVEDPIPTYTLTTSLSPNEGGKITISTQESSYPEGTQVCTSKFEFMPRNLMQVT